MEQSTEHLSTFLEKQFGKQLLGLFPTKSKQDRGLEKTVSIPGKLGQGRIEGQKGHFKVPNAFPGVEKQQQKVGHIQHCRKPYPQKKGGDGNQKAQHEQTGEPI